MAICGIGFGYLVGCGLALLQATTWLDQYSKAAATQNDASVAEARSVLNVLKSSEYPFCSDAEIGYFRDVLFRSEHLKDAGHIHNVKIDCSATAGHAARTGVALRPDYRLADGSLAYSNLDPIQDAGLKRAALQLGSTYVVFGADPLSNPGPIPMHLSMTMQGDRIANDDGASGNVSASVVPHMAFKGSGHLGNTLYATNCSAQQSGCVTAYTSVSEALHGESDMMSSSAIAGGLAGILIGMGFSFAYSHHREIAQQLRRAIEQDKIHIVYQPIVNLATRQIVGAEALSRWTDEDGNVVPPDVFVKIAEEAGFIGLITRSVLRHTLQDFASVMQNRPHFHISINVSAADLVDPGFLPMLDESLKNAKVKPESLVIEITERAAADNERAMETIRNLRRMGHSIHIDDFGTGYSNLDRLLYLFADTIKIDKAFTSVIGTESVAAAILPQILSMAKTLNLEVVVEGVETAHQADYFEPGEQKIYAQGWLYGRPVSIDAFMGVLADNQATLPESAVNAETFTTKPGTLQLVPSRVA
jgi:sensor c-di-GMP phosphodiesterase-like protein